MSDKISALDPGDSLAASDIFPFTDVSDTSESASGKTKKSTLTLLYNYILSVLGTFSSTSGNPSTGNLVPSIASGDSTYFFNSLGQWAVPLNTTYEEMGSGNGYALGLVAAGSASPNREYYRKDGTYVQILEDTTETSKTTPTVINTYDAAATAPSIAAGTIYVSETVFNEDACIMRISGNMQVTTNHADQVFGATWARAHENMLTSGFTGDYKGTGVIYRDDMSSGGEVASFTVTLVDADTIRFDNIKLGAIVSSVDYVFYANFSFPVVTP